MKLEPSPLDRAIEQIDEATAARKCWSCGCFHGALDAIARALPPEDRPVALSVALEQGRAPLLPVRYDCLGCEVCYPALAINALQHMHGNASLDIAACPTEQVGARAGWPPLPGTYQVLRYQAPVAVCSLTDEPLAAAIAREAPVEVAITGPLQTENLGIERLIQNVLANPNIRFVVLCGEDTRQAIGHLPGQSLLALAASGLDDRGRIIGARGKRPVIKNISREAAEHFRRTVEVIDLVGVSDVATILEAIRGCAVRNPGPASAFAPEDVVTPVAGHLPSRLIPDPAGYFVLYVDRARKLLSLEHYRNDGVLTKVIEGRSPAELFAPAIELELISRLDHAAYLGQELARAELALISNSPYIQDAAPERTTAAKTLVTAPDVASRRVPFGAGPARQASKVLDCGCSIPCHPENGT